MRLRSFAPNAFPSERRPTKRAPTGYIVLSNQPAVADYVDDCRFSEAFSTPSEGTQNCPVREDRRLIAPLFHAGGADLKLGEDQDRGSK
jgi:hypothetical protein